MTMIGSQLTPADRLILALADRLPITLAAAQARMKSGDAVAEATFLGWPDLTKIEAAAAAIRKRAKMPPRKLRERDPIPLEPEVEAAMTAGVTQIQQARASIALDRDQTHDVGPVQVLATSTTARDAAADEAVDAMAGHGLDAAVQALEEDGVTAETIATLRAIDPLTQALIGGATATLSMPLGSLVDIDGRETILGRAVFHIELDRRAVIAGLRAENPEPPFLWSVEHTLTDEGRHAIRQLTGLLDAEKRAPGRE